MPYARSKSRGISTGLVIVLVFLLVAGTAVGGVGTLWLFGKIELPFLSRGDKLPDGYDRVLVSARTIPAYTKITRDDVIDPKTRDFASIPVPRETITDDVLTDYNQIRGRVINHEKPANYVFKEEDFFPKGTRAGLAGAIPPGKRSLLLEVAKISGVHGLKVGDHIDLVATIPVEVLKGGGMGKFNSGLQAETQLASMQKLANVRILAQDAVLLTPVTARQKPTVSKSISQGTTVRNIPVEEVTIAVDPAEVAPVTQALATDVNVMCVVRSGQPGDPAAHTDTPGSDPLAGITSIDTISGDKREVVTLPDYGNHTSAMRPHPAAARKKASAAGNTVERSSGSLWENVPEAVKAH
jgi:Flp pilus assembly protein CpaB